MKKMCDLIDLNSPDVKRLVDPKLASPLIPVPRNMESNSETNLSVTEKRESLGSNPFDKVLQETTEYIRKKGDPFEVMLEKALKFKNKKAIELRSQSVSFIDDFTPKRRKYLKTLNKTLDESLIENKSNLFIGEKETITKIREKDFNLNTNRSETIRDNTTIESMSTFKQNHKIFCTDADDVNSSISNYFSMNDTLLETITKLKENSEKIFSEEVALSKEFTLLPRAGLKSLDIRRSFSQGDKKSPNKLQCLNQRSSSTIDISRKSSQNDSSSFLNKGFLESRRSESILPDLSNISAITSISSSVVSNDTFNHAFINSASLKTESCDNTSENFVEKKSMQYDLSDLAEKLNKLKCADEKRINASTITDYSDKSDTKFVNKEDSKQSVNNKLIDVDIFVPIANCNKGLNSSTSNSSSDSVFIDSSKVNKSILNEAKALAKTFEELSLKTDTGSSMDDLISNNTLWMSELFEDAFEDEAVVDNLIELPVSSEENVKDAENKDEKKSAVNSNNEREIFLKGIESQFTECAPTERQTIVTTLLLDLKKLVEAENNTEANKLLDNLENVLGVKWKTNAELLSTCLNITNNLQVSIQTTDNTDNRLDNINEKSEKDIDRNEEENIEVLSKEKTCDNKNLELNINHELKDTSQITIIDSDNSSSNSSSLIPKDNKNLSITKSEIKNSDDYPDQKLAVELLINLGKLLSSETEDTATLHLLKNIRKVLNSASHNGKIANKLQTDNGMHNQSIISTKISESENMRSFVLTKPVHKRNLKSKSEQREKTSRRSISVIQSPIKNTSNTQMIKHKEISQMKEVKKRLSENFTGTLSNKKVIETIHTNIPSETMKTFDTKKEKPIPILDVKNKLKKKLDTVNKKGPIKAIHPVGNMHKRVSLGKQTIRFSQSGTPPKSDTTITAGNKIISSTPNSVNNNHTLKKTVKSKPVAASTPDGQSVASTVQLLPANNSKRRNFMCDISPVTPHANTNDINESKNSPKRSNKLPTPKKCTPKRVNSSGIPRYLTPPNIKKHNTSLDTNNQFLLESPQRLNKSLTNCQRYSPVFPKKNTGKLQQSPLKERNKLTPKVKPFNLVSKLRRHNMDDSAEKENHYS